MEALQKKRQALIDQHPKLD
ncbi:hypothetical protein LOS02_07910 [Proteus mirabilis]|nr:hypothetical protein [Proteus mirabilis]